MSSMGGGGSYSRLGLCFGAQVERRGPCIGKGVLGIGCQNQSGRGGVSISGDLVQSVQVTLQMLTSKNQSPLKKLKHLREMVDFRQNWS